MSWIGGLVDVIADCLSMEVSGWKWDIGNGEFAGYQLIIFGANGKRVVKLFTDAELDTCLIDPQLQSDIKIRLTPLVSFIGVKVRSKKPIKRKKQESKNS